MNLQDLIKKYLDEEKAKEFMDEMKSNKIYVASEENMDVRYSKLKGDFDAKTKEHEEATRLIEELKANNKGNEDLQSKIGSYESEVANLKEELEKTKIESSLKVALANAKATDADYIAYKVRELNKDLTLDENGNIKGIDETLKEIKTSFPNFFEGEKKKEIEVNDLKKGEVKEMEPTSLVEALQQKYDQSKGDL
jgi:hypothetical protein